jgi:hypothetical protein
MQSEAKSRDVIHIKQTELLQRDMEQMRSRERAIIEVRRLLLMYKVKARISVECCTAVLYIVLQEKAALSHERQSLDEMRAKQLCVSCKRPVTAPRNIK